MRERDAFEGEVVAAQVIEVERDTLLKHVHAAVDGIMVVLSIAWIGLLVAELVGGGLPRLLDVAVWVIWAIFALDFAVEFVIAPRKVRCLRTPWLTVLSLALPAFRIVRMR